MWAHANGLIQFPPRLRSEVQGQYYNLSRQQRWPARGAVAVNLTGWPYLNDWGLTPDQALRKLPPRMRVLEFRMAPGLCPSNSPACYDPFTYTVLLVPSDNLRDIGLSLDHELTHFLQHVQSLIVGKVAGVPSRGRLPKTKTGRLLEAQLRADGRMDPFLFEHVHTPSLDRKIRSVKSDLDEGVEHARLPFEYYTRLRDEVAELTYLMRQWGKQESTPLPVNRVVRAWMRDRAFFASLEYDPRIHRKLVGEFYKLVKEELAKDEPKPSRRGKVSR